MLTALLYIKIATTCSIWYCYDQRFESAVSNRISRFPDIAAVDFTCVFVESGCRKLPIARHEDNVVLLTRCIPCRLSAKPLQKSRMTCRLSHPSGKPGPPKMISTLSRRQMQLRTQICMQRTKRVRAPFSCSTSVTTCLAHARTGPSQGFG